MSIIRTDPTGPGARGALRSAPYRWLVSGATITNLGNGIAPVALAFAVLDLGGSATDLGAVVALYALADVVTVLFGGVLGDRLPRQLLMVGSATMAALSQALVAIALIGDFATIWMLGLFGMLNGMLGALNGPSSQAMTRQTVAPESLAPAISLRRMAQNAAQIVGFSLAGVLVAWLGSGPAIAVDAASFALAGLCYSRISVPRLPAPIGTSMLGDLREGAAEVLNRTWLWALIVQALVYHLFYGGAQGVLGPIVMGDSLGRPAWGWAMGAMMSGFLVGGLVTLRWRPKRALLVGTCFLGLTAAFPAAMALSDLLVVVLLGAFVHGFGLEIFSVGWDLSIQENVPEDKLARVYAFDSVGSFVARPIGLALTGPIAEVVGLRAWLVVVAAVMLGSDLLALLLKDVRRLERRAP